MRWRFLGAETGLESSLAAVKLIGLVIIIRPGLVRAVVFVVAVVVILGLVA